MKWALMAAAVGLAGVTRANLTLPTALALPDAGLVYGGLMDRAAFVAVPQSRNRAPRLLADPATLHRLAEIFRSAAFVPAEHLLAISTPIVFYDRSHHEICHLELYQSQVRLDGVDYATDRKTIEELKAEFKDVVVPVSPPNAINAGAQFADWVWQSDHAVVGVLDSKAKEPYREARIDDPQALRKIGTILATAQLTPSQEVYLDLPLPVDFFTKDKQLVARLGMSGSRVYLNDCGYTIDRGSAKELRDILALSVKR